MRQPTILSDYVLIDAIEALGTSPWSGNIFRSCKHGRDVLQGSASRGRWDDGSFDVLYTSLSLTGSIEEMRFHLGRGQPIIPDKPIYKVHEISAELSKVISIEDTAMLDRLGVDLAKFGRASYHHHQGEYSRTQELGSVAHFLDADGLLVPSARSNSKNLVIFCDQIVESSLRVIKDHGTVSQIANSTL